MPSAEEEVVEARATADEAPAMAEAPDLRPHLALYAVTLFFANINVFDIELRRTWALALAIVLGALGAQGFVARRRNQSPPYDGVFFVAFCFHFVVGAGIFAAIALQLRSKSEPLFHTSTQLLEVPFALAALAVGMNLLFFACMGNAIRRATPVATTVSRGDPHRGAALRGPWRSALAGIAVYTIFAMPVAKTGLHGLSHNPGTWIALLALAAQVPLALADAELLSRAAREQRPLPDIVAADPYRGAPPADPSEKTAPWLRAAAFCRKSLRSAAITTAVCAASCLAHAWRAA